MNDDLVDAAFLALIDDDEHSAQLLTRTLMDRGAPGVRYYGDAELAHRRLGALLADPEANLPRVIIVDLKEHSGANLEFLETARQLLGQCGVSVVVLTAHDDDARRQALLDHGAASVLVRHADRDAYRRVAADIVQYATHQARFEAVGM